MRKMRINIMTVTGLLLILFLCANASARIQDMKLLTPKIGWVATETKLYWTTNSGATWKNITPQPENKGNIISVFFLKPSQGWVLFWSGSKIGSKELNLAYTDDSGATWSTKPIALLGTLEVVKSQKNKEDKNLNEDEKRIILDGKGRIDFVDSKHGSMIWKMPISTPRSHENAIMLKTVDGGINWRLANNQLLLPVTGSFHFITTTEGWLAGDDGNLCVTHNGGDTWQQVSLKAPDKLVSIGDTQYVWPHYDLPIFKDSRNGFLSVTYNDGVHNPMGLGMSIPSLSPIDKPVTLALFATHDSGQTWKSEWVLKNPFGMSSSTLVDSIFVTAIVSATERTLILIQVLPDGKVKRTAAKTGDWWANMTKPRLYDEYAQGGGGRFGRVTIGSATYTGLGKFSFATSNQGWMMTYDKLLATNDGGTTWSLITPGADSDSLEPKISANIPFKMMPIIKMVPINQVSPLLSWLGPQVALNLMPIMPKTVEKTVTSPSSFQWKTEDMNISLIGMACGPANSPEMIAKGRAAISPAEKPRFFPDRPFALALHFHAKASKQIKTELYACSGLSWIKNRNGEIEGPMDLTSQGFVKFPNLSGIRDVHFQRSDSVEYWEFFPISIKQKEFFFQAFSSSESPPLLSFQISLQENDLVVSKPTFSKLYTTNFGNNNLTVIDGSEAIPKNGFIDVGSSPSALVVNSATNKIYVINQGSVNAPTCLKAQGKYLTSAEESPHAVAIDSIVNKIFVANWSSNNVTMIDEAGKSKSIAVGINPYAIAVNSETHTAYVVNHYSNDVTVIDQSGTTKSIAVGLSPYGVAVNQVTNKIYIANGLSDDVTVINGSDNSTTSIAVGTAPYSVAINPLTNRIYVANWDSGNVTVINGTNNSTTTIAVGTNPGAVAINSLTNKIYIANTGSNDVTVINGADNSTKTIVVAVDSAPYSLAVNPVTDKIYVVDIDCEPIKRLTLGRNNITVINGKDNSTSTIEVGTCPCAVTVNSATNKVYIANNCSNNLSVISE